MLSDGAKGVTYLSEEHVCDGGAGGVGVGAAHVADRG